MQRLYDWAAQPLDNEQALVERANFYSFYQEHDRRRNTDFAKTFPELEELIKLSTRAYDIFRGNYDIKKA